MNRPSISNGQFPLSVPTPQLSIPISMTPPPQHRGQFRAQRRRDADLAGQRRRLPRSSRTGLGRAEGRRRVGGRPAAAGLSAPHRLGFGNSHTLTRGNRRERVPEFMPVYFDIADAYSLGRNTDALAVLRVSASAGRTSRAQNARCLLVRRGARRGHDVFQTRLLSRPTASASSTSAARITCDLRSIKRRQRAPLRR